MVSAACRIVFGFVTLFALLMASRPDAMATPSADDPAAVKAEIARIYDWAGYQRDLPGEEPPASPAPPDKDRTVSLEASPLVSTILIGVLAMIALVVVAWLRTGGWSLLLQPAAVAPVDDAAPTSRREQLKARLDDADRSAVSGDWASAIHTLLLTSIDLLRRRLGQDVPEAMTARELVDRAQVPDPVRGDFAALVAAAELCHFGGRAADRSLYDRCRAHYERLWGIAPEPVT
jgi:hypothetical protein